MDLGEFTMEQAKPLEGTTFELSAPNGETISMTLEEVLPYETAQRRRSSSPEIKRQPFALYFLSPSAAPLSQGMYTLRSERMTFTDLFIVPVGRLETGIEYEAIFT